MFTNNDLMELVSSNEIKLTPNKVGDIKFKIFDEHESYVLVTKIIQIYDSKLTSLVNKTTKTW